MVNSRERSFRIVGLILAAAIRVPGGAVFPDHPTKDIRSVGMIGRYVDGKFLQSGSGVAISSNWVIGVSHVGGSSFLLDGKRYSILQKIVQSGEYGEPTDLALYKLAEPVPESADVLLAPFDGPRGLKGRTVYLVGCGRTAKLRADGLGWQPAEGSEGTRRVATNTIDSRQVSRYNIGSTSDARWRTSQTLGYDLDKPGTSKFNSMGGRATANEGGVGARDSGGGWFVKSGGRYQLVAISATVGKAPGSTMTSPYGYGGQGFGIWLEPYKDWIFATTGLKAFR